MLKLSKNKKSARRTLLTAFAAAIILQTTPALAQQSLPYAIVDTNQRACYDNTKALRCAGSGTFFGQDAQYQGHEPHYTDNGDGTITDTVTGLMWIKDAGGKTSYAQGIKKGRSFTYAGYSDWRVPSIKELYSLMDFDGMDIMAELTSGAGQRPFIDTKYFDFEYGDTATGSRIIDSQWMTTSIYGAKVMHREECFFGVNFADGRIKCYPTQPRRGHGWFLRMVRGNPSYGKNNFSNNNNGTITDKATGLTWQQSDSRKGMNWADALSYCESLSLAGKDDWRLPNAKELQSIVDYSRAPDTTGSAAINPLFDASTITNESGAQDWPFYWSSTTHKSMMGMSHGVYVSFGRALGNMNKQGWIDVHGAGAQRSDPKSGVPIKDGHGPQGDAQRVKNYVRCVRGGATFTTDTTYDTSKTQAPLRGNNGGEGRNGQGRRPPQEAISACAGKSSGSCSFTTPRGRLTGTCRQTPDGATACVPR